MVRVVKNMERLWAPWRIKYIKMEKPKGCIFCEKVKEERDEENLILYRGENAFIIMNAFPYNNGHLMVAPYRHVPTLENLDDDELLEVFKLVNFSLKILRKVMKPDGFNIGVNIGRVAGAGIEEHVHVHVVPRWNGDTNFMPVIADTKVISEGLNETYKNLKTAITEQQTCQSRRNKTI